MYFGHKEESIIYIYEKTSMNNISWYRLRESGGITDMAMFASDVQPSATSKYAYSSYPACTISLLPAGLPRSGKLPVLNLLTGQKSRFSPRRGDSLHHIHVKFGTADGHLGLLSCATFTSVGAGGGNASQKYQKFPLFGKESPRGTEANPLTDF